MSIEFTRPQQSKGQARFVRFEQDVDAELVEIADRENVDLAEVIRTFTGVGLEEYNKQFKDKEE